MFILLVFRGGLRGRSCHADRLVSGRLSAFVAAVLFRGLVSDIGFCYFLSVVALAFLFRCYVSSVVHFH